MDYATQPPKRQMPSPALNAVYRQLEMAGLLYSLTDDPPVRDALDRLRDAQLTATVAIARQNAGVAE